MSKGVLRGDVKVCCTVYFQLFYPTCLLQQNKPLIILHLRNDSQFVSFRMTADVTTAGTGKMKFTVINLSFCPGTQVLNINDYHGIHILLENMTITQLVHKLHTFYLPKIYLNSILSMPVSHILDFSFNSLNQCFTHGHMCVKEWLSYIINITPKQNYDRESLKTDLYGYRSLQLVRYTSQTENQTPLYRSNHDRPGITWIIYWVEVKD